MPNYFDATTGIDNLVGTSGNAADLFNFDNGTVQAGDKIDGRGGTDYVQVAAGANVDFTVMGAHFTGVEGIQVLGGGVATFTSAQVGGGTGNLPSSFIIHGDTTDHTTIETINFNMGSATSINLSGATFNGTWGAEDVLHITGSGGADKIIGTSHADTIDAGGGNDLIRGAAGNDTIDGGAGTDGLVISNTLDSLTSSGDHWIVAGPDGTDTVTGVEYVTDGMQRTLLVGGGGFGSIQDAVNFAEDGDTIVIANGDYLEQVTLNGKSGLTLVGESEGGVVIHAPATSVQTGTDPINGKAIFATIDVNDSSNINLKNLTVDGDSHAGGIAAGGDFVGIAYLNSSGVVDHVTAQEYRDTLVDPNTVSGNQRGTDILSSNTTGAPNALEISNSTIQDFQKTGVVARNTDVYFHNNDVHGFGVQSIIAQNGIQLSSGSTGDVSDNHFDGIGFSGATNSVADILAFNADGVSITGNTFVGTHANDLGVALTDTNGATVSNNSFDGQTWALGNYGDITTPSTVVNQGVDANTFTNIDPNGAGYDLEPNSGLTTVFNEQGGSAGDYMTGAAGNDHLAGFGGDDALLGNGGADDLTGGSGNDALDGGAGIDTAHYSAGLTASAFSVVADQWTVTTAADNTDTLSNLERATDGTHNFLLVGDGGYATLQDALAASVDGDTILLAPGTYDLSTTPLSITHSVTIMGPNHGVAGDGTRGAEAILQGPANGAAISLGDGLTVTIDGVKFTGDHIVDHGAAGDTFAWNNSVFDLTTNADNNIYFGYSGGYDFTFDNNAVNTTGYTDGVIDAFEGGTVHISGNTFTATVDPANPDQNAVGLNLNGVSGEVTDNTFTHNDIGVLIAGTAHDLDVTGNTFDAATRGPADTSTGSYGAGVLLFDPHYTGNVNISDNTFENSDSGIRTSSYNSGSVAGQPLTIDGNTFENNLHDLVASATGILHLTDSTLDGAATPEFFVGGPTADTITGTSGVDLISGGAGDDTITAAGGNDYIDGGDGTDTAVFSGPITSATYDTGDQTWTVVSADGTDVVKNVEVLQTGATHTILVSEGGSIQAAIDAAGVGDTIIVAAGTYNENVNVNKAGLTLVGQGQVTLQGTFETDNHVSGPLHTFLQTAAAYGGQAGDGVTVSANNVTVQNIDIQGFLHGVEFASDVSGAALTDVDIAHSVIGIDKTATADVSGLTVTGGSVTDGYIGVNFAKATGVSGVGEGVASNVTINGMDFSDLTQKGIYAETLTNSTIENVDMTNVGQWGGGPAFGANGKAGNGIDLNLKAGTYSDISIHDIHLTDTGASDQNGAHAADPNGGAVVIEARSDGATYGPAPAVVTDTIAVSNVTIDGHTSIGVEVGEPGKANADPDVALTHVSITGATQGEVGNQTQSVTTYSGTANADTVSTTATSTGEIDFTGAGGNDSFTGHAELDIAHFAATLSLSDITATGLGWTVNGGAEGTDTLTGVEKVVDGSGKTYLLVGPQGGYASIQAAVNAAHDGDTIIVAAGTYNETVTITKGVDIIGAKHGIDGAASGRGVGDGAGETNIDGRIIINTSQDVVVDGVRFVDDAAAGINGASQPSVYVTQSGATGAGHEILNSVFYSTVAGGNTATDDDRAVFIAGSATGAVTVTGNYITASTLGQYGTAGWGRGIWSDGGGQTLDIEHNTLQSVRSGVNLDGYNDASTTLANNTFTLVGTAISVGSNTTSSTFAGIHDNLFQTSDEDLNLHNMTGAETIDIGGTGNISPSGQTFYTDGSQGADTITGATTNDIITASSGNDNLTGGGGDDYLDGGADTDTAHYSQTITAGMISTDTTTGVTTVTTGGAEGTDTLVNIEFITDGVHTFNLSSVNSPVAFGPAPASASVTEDVSVTSGQLTASQTGAFTDLDPSDTHSVTGTYSADGSDAKAATVAGNLVAGTDYSVTATVDEAGHTVGYAWSVSNAAVNGLTSGETITLTAHETISDGVSTSSEDVVLVIHGHNDAPVVHSVFFPGPAEDTAATITTEQLLIGTSDPDTANSDLTVSGLTASSGTVADNHDGTWTYTPASNFSGPVSFNFNVNDGDNTVGGTGTATVTPVSDTPTVSATAASGTEATPIALHISAASTDTDGSETVSVTLGGYPAGSVFNAGVNNGDGTWTVTQAQLSGLTITTPAGYHSDFSLTVTASAKDGSAAAATASTTEAVHVDAGSGAIVAAADTLVLTKGLISALDASNLVTNDTGGTGGLHVTSITGLTGATGGLVGDQLQLTATAASGGFTYTVMDDGGHTQTGNATFTALVSGSGADTLNGSVATAADLQGQAGNDILTGSAGADHFIGAAGNDTMSGGNGDDVFQIGAGSGIDSISGGMGHDTIIATAANAIIGLSSISGIEAISSGGFSGVTITGSAVDDILDFSGATLTGITSISGAGGVDTITGSEGNDTIVGGAGDDILKGGGGDDTFNMIGNFGNDSVDGGSGYDTIHVGTNNSSLSWANVTGVEAVTGILVKIIGSDGNDVLDFSGVSLTGVSKIYAGLGDDTVIGSAGNDVIGFSEGTDTLTGGGGSDIFDMDNINQSGVGALADTITDFTNGADKISLKDSDANTNKDGDQAFSWLGLNTFTGVAGQLRYLHSDPGSTTVLGDVNGDGVADFEIHLIGYHVMSASDFSL